MHARLISAPSSCISLNNLEDYFGQDQIGHSYPSTARRRNQRKLRSGCMNGGPFSMDGCFCVYVVNTTDALVLFFRQRNLQRKCKKMYKTALSSERHIVLRVS